MGGVACTLFREPLGRRSFLAMPNRVERDRLPQAARRGEPGGSIKRRRSARSCSNSSSFVAGQPAVWLSRQLQAERQLGGGRAHRGAGAGAAVRSLGVHEGAEAEDERRFVDEFFERQREYFGERRKRDLV